jgi:hypothetical protein
MQLIPFQGCSNITWRYVSFIFFLLSEKLVIYIMLGLNFIHNNALVIKV